MAKTVCWSIAATAMVCAIVYGCTQYSIEELKQNSFMMKACADAGGNFTVSWGRPLCLRPNATH